ncbi:unnamed protein product, partial [Symbiodinium sp. KB8]
MLGQTLVTKQTGPEGKLVNKVFLMERVYMRREMYLSIVMDRAAAGPLLVASPFGGTSIEDVAASNPDAILAVPTNIEEGLTEKAIDRVLEHLSLKDTPVEEAGRNCVKNLYRMFLATDVNFDDNAEFRQKDIFAKRDTTQEDPREVAAAAA